MPSLKLSNPFRRGVDRPSLKQRAASLKAAAARVMGRKATEPFTAESAASLSFDAYTFDQPVCSPAEWGLRLNEQILGLLLTERLLRMGKAEMTGFICDAGESDAEALEVMLHTLTDAQEAFEGWGRLLNVAIARFTVAASSAVIEADSRAKA